LLNFTDIGPKQRLPILGVIVRLPLQPDHKRLRRYRIVHKERRVPFRDICKNLAYVAVRVLSSQFSGSFPWMVKRPIDAEPHRQVSGLQPELEQLLALVAAYNEDTISLRLEKHDAVEIFGNAPLHHSRHWPQ
jgi:hypothetical protein